MRAAADTAIQLRPAAGGHRITVLGCRSAGEEGCIVDLLLEGVNSNDHLRPASLAASMSGVWRANVDRLPPFTAPLLIQRMDEGAAVLPLTPPVCDFAEYQRANEKGNPFPYYLIGTPPIVTPEGLVPQSHCFNDTNEVVQPVVWRTPGGVRRGERLRITLDEQWLRTKGGVPATWSVVGVPVEVEVDKYR